MRLFSNLVLFSILIAGGAIAAPQVIVGETTVVGKDQSSQVEFFGGIPFAYPPIGARRLAPAELKTTFDAPSFDASQFGASCLQVQSFSDTPGQYSEDCLTVNIYRPSGIAANASLPILVWIYGGAFIGGASRDIDGTSLVTRSLERGTPVIVASLNYRVGPLGFPQGAEADKKGILNLGFKDQLVALQWFQANIGAFGGDKSKVTVFGESAGGSAIYVHLLGKTFPQVARGAILESAAVPPTFPAARNEFAWEQFVAAVPQCASSANTSSTIECLRQSATSESLLQALKTAQPYINAGTFGPCLDGPGGLIPTYLSQVPPPSRIPMIIGSNLDEGTFFAQDAHSNAEIGSSLWNSLAPSPRGDQALQNGIDRIFQLYPDDPSLGSPYGTGNETFGLGNSYKRYASILGDLLFQSGRRAFAGLQSNLGTKVWSYHFTDPDVNVLGLPSDANPYGVSHVSEIGYVFGSLKNASSAAATLSQNMQDYWLSFATSLNPNDGRGSPRPQWPEYNGQISLQLNGHNLTTIQDNFRSPQISYFFEDPLLFSF